MVVSLIMRIGVHFSLGVLKVVSWFDRICFFSIDRKAVLSPGGGMGWSDILCGGILYGVCGILPQEFQDVEVFLSFLVEFLIADGRSLPFYPLVHIWVWSKEYFCFPLRFWWVPWTCDWHFWSSVGVVDCGGRVYSWFASSYWIASGCVFLFQSFCLLKVVVPCDSAFHSWRWRDRLLNFERTGWEKGYADVLQTLLVEVLVFLVDLVHDELVEGGDVAVHTVIESNYYLNNKIGTFWYVGG